MTETVARDVAHQVAVQARKDLDRLLHEKNLDLQLCRQPLEVIRDRLDETCRQFEDTDMCQDLEEHYLHLFDALSLLNEALGLKKISRGLVEEAARILNQLKRNGGAW